MDFSQIVQRTGEVRMFLADDSPQHLGGFAEQRCRPFEIAHLEAEPGQVIQTRSRGGMSTVS